MKKTQPISEIMSTKLKKVSLKDDLYKAEQIMLKNKIRHLPVVTGEKLNGIISMTDILKISYGESLTDGDEPVNNAIFDMLTIDQIMQHEPQFVHSTQPIKEVAEILIKAEFHALPVVHDGILVGIVSTNDVIKYLLEQY